MSECSKVLTENGKKNLSFNPQFTAPFWNVGFRSSVEGCKIFLETRPTGNLSCLFWFFKHRSDYGSETRDERGISDSGNRFIENTSTPHYGRGYHHHRHNRSSLASEKQLEHGFTQTSANNTPTHQGL